MLIPLIDAVDPGQQFGNDNIELGWDVIIEIGLHQQGHQLGRFMYEHTGFSGAADDLFGNQPPTFGDDTRCKIAGRVGQR